MPEKATSLPASGEHGPVDYDTYWAYLEHRTQKALHSPTPTWSHRLEFDPCRIPESSEVRWDTGAHLQIPYAALRADLLQIQQGPLAMRVKSTLQDVLAAFIRERSATRALDGRLVGGIIEHISRLEHKIEELARELKSRPVTSIATLYDLGIDEFGLTQPLQIVIEQYEEEVTASWPETQAFGSGSSASEAILALKRDLIALYSDLQSTPDGELGTLVLTWKKTLGKVVVPNGTPER